MTTESITSIQRRMLIHMMPGGKFPKDCIFLRIKVFFLLFDRGFFFAHVGWLFITPHPEVEAKRKVIDMSDLTQDGVVMFQKKYFIILFALLAIGMPVLVPVYFWNETLWISFWICFNLRFTTTLNIAFFVNSVAHMYGRRPYDK